MSDFKKCDRCDVTGEIDGCVHPMHMHLPTGWATVAFSIQSSTPAFATVVGAGYPGSFPGDVFDGIGPMDHGAPEPVDFGVMVQSHLDLCPSCLKGMIEASGCPEKIKTEPSHGRMRPPMYRGRGGGLRAVPPGPAGPRGPRKPH
jgi:hypothetical protein